MNFGVYLNGVKNQEFDFMDKVHCIWKRWQWKLVFYKLYRESCFCNKSGTGFVTSLENEEKGY